jgi:hypothetical protein
VRVVKIPMDLEEFLTSHAGYSPEEARSAARALIESGPAPSIVIAHHHVSAPAQVTAPEVHRRSIPINGTPRICSGTPAMFARLATLKRRQSLHTAIGRKMTSLAAMFSELGAIDGEMFDQSASLMPNVPVPSNSSS